MDSGWAKCAIGAAAGAALGVAIALPLAIAATGSNLETKGAPQAADRDGEAADPSSGAGVPASPRVGGPAFQDRYVHRAYRCDPLMGGPGDATRPRAPGTETRVLHCLRHAQGTHNVAVATHGCEAYTMWKFRDARLTPVGVEQAKTAIETASKLRLDTVLVSPLSRTLQTAQIGMPDAYGSGKMRVCELIRERHGLNPCDLRREKHELETEFPGVNFDDASFSETDQLWSATREPLPELQARANAFLDYIFESPLCGEHVGIVTHNDFLTMLLYDSALEMGPTMPVNRKFKNCELNSYVITRTKLCPSLDDGCLTDDQTARYPASTGTVPVVQ